MNVFDFNDRGRAHVSEQEFMDYLAKTSYPDDYTKISEMECEVDDKNRTRCECLLYYNSNGCLLASYNRDFGYGELF